MSFRFAPLLLTLLAPASFAQSPVDVGLLGAAPLDKPVRTFRDLRYRDIVRQQFDFSCGSAALATLLRGTYGMEADEKDLIRKMITRDNAKRVVQQGFSMLDMKRYVETTGMHAQGFRIDSKALYRLQIPVVALQDYKGYKHFVVIKGAEAGRVYVADPALGHRVVSEEEFAKGWNGIVLAVTGDRPLVASAIVDGRGSPALRGRVDALGRATMPVPVVELGLVRTDLF